MLKNEDLEPSDYNNLILDDMAIGSITEEEKNYLAKFTTLECLSLNQNDLVSLVNLPEAKLVKIELNDN